MGIRLWVMGIRLLVVWVFSYGFLLSVKLMQRYSFCFNKAIFLEIIHKKRPRGSPLRRAVRAVTFSFLHMVFAKGDLSPAERSPFIMSTVTLCMAKGDLWLFRRLVVCWFCAIFCFIQYVDFVIEGLRCFPIVACVRLLDINLKPWFLMCSGSCLLSFRMCFTHSHAMACDGQKPYPMANP